MDDPSVAASFKAQANSTTNEISSWSQQLKEVESKFGVASDEKMDYPNRIKEIEKIASEQAEQKEKFKMPSILEKEEIEAIARLVEQAEERWGVEVPENFNLAQRIELIEKTAFNFMARLQVWL
jgi:cysteinyl-tRNA synthetase